MMKRRSGKVSPAGYIYDEESSVNTGTSSSGSDEGGVSLPGPPYPGDSPKRSRDGSLGRHLSVDLDGDAEDKERLPSARAVTGKLPECQDKYERVFSKPLVEIKRQNLLPNYMRAKLVQDSEKELSGCSAWRKTQRLSWAKCKIRCREVGYRFDLWRGSIKTVEGHYGSGVVSYFQFLKWLFLLNIGIFLLIGVFVVIPQIVFRSHGYEQWVLSNTSVIDVNQTEYCTSLYTVTVDTTDVLTLVLDFLQGTGWLEQTMLFYGHYTDNRLAIGTWDHVTHFYSLPLAYLIVTFVIFGLSLCLMVKHTASAFRARITEAMNKYGNVVFGGWDYALNDTKAKDLKHRSLYNEILADLHEDRDARRRAGRESRDKCRLYTARLCINLFVLAVLGACGYGIYYSTDESLKFKERADYEQTNEFVKLLMEYVPSLAITVLNLIVPLLFTSVAKGEDFSPETEIQVTLGRTVFLRLASLAVLLGTVYSQVTCSNKDTACQVGILPECPPLRCWETYVGQQLYKLIILDFFVVLGKVLLLDFPRRVIVTKCDCKLARLIGKPEFEIPKEVLGLVYTQTLCWIGAFFSPLIPTMCVLSFFFIFYLKKLTCIYNHVPPERPYHAARSRVFFMVVLIAAFVLCCVPVGYVIWRIPPSRGCGPFRIYTTIYSVAIYTVNSWPRIVRQIISFIGSAAVVVPGIIILILCIYYCFAVAKARNEIVYLMREQLHLERKDKKFLLRRVQNDPATTQGPRQTSNSWQTESTY